MTLEFAYALYFVKIPPAIEIPQVQDTENRAQNETAGGIGGIGRIFSTEGGSPSQSQSQFQPQSQPQPAIYSYSCYYCEKAGKKFEANDEVEYLKHGANKHPKKPLFPNNTDLKKYHLKPQGKSWENKSSS